MRDRRFAVAAAFGLLAVLRVATLATEPWEWDEVLYTQAVAHGLDVRVNHPHAPGYPAFVLFGRLLHAAGAGAFASATLVAAAGGVLAALGLFFLLEALGVSRESALGGAVLYGLCPAVWIHSVRPLSDAPAAAAWFFSAALLVKARKSLRARELALGAALAAVAFGVRPQVGLTLAPLALWAAAGFGRARFRAVLASGALGVVLSVALYVPVVAGSGGWTPWRAALAGQMRFTRGESPAASQMLSLGFWKRWCLDPWNGGDVGYPLLAVAAVACALAPRRAGALVLVFAPLTALTIGLLYPGHAPRYALGILGLPCGLAAVAADALRLRGPRSGKAAAVALTALAGAAAWVAVPAVVELREKTPPSVAVFRRLLEDPTLGDRPALVQGPLEVHAAWLLPAGRWRIAEDGAPPRPRAGEIVVWSDETPEGLRMVADFRFANPNLRRLSRARYLSAGLYEAP